MHRIDFKHISHFLEAARTCNMVKAAKRHGVSQPSITQSIRFLEEQLGASLFRRTDHGLRLTPFGRDFRERALAFRNRFTAEIGQTQVVSREETGRVRIGLAVDCVGRALATCMVAARDRKIAEVVPVDLSAQDGVAGTESGSLDMAVVGGRVDPNEHDSLEMEAVVSNSVAVYLPEHHEAARNGKITLEMLSRLPLVLMNQAAFPGHQCDLEQLFLRHGLCCQVAQVAGNEWTLINYARAGLGAALIVGPFSKSMHPGLARLEVPDLRPHVPRRLEIVSRRRRNYPAFVQVRAMLLQQLRLCAS